MDQARALTPFLTQYLGVKKEHPDKLVLFRMGDFFEVFFEDAKEASVILGITLTARNSKDADPIPMAGIPHHALEGYLPKLIRAGKKVAICDQVEDPALAKGIVKREVVRIVTRGTLTEDSLLDASRNNFLLSLCEGKGGYSLAYMDFSTGEVFVRRVKVSRLVDLIASLRPDELVYPRNFEKSLFFSELKSQLEIPFNPLDDWHFNPKQGFEQSCRVYDVKGVDGFGLEPDSDLLSPLGGLFFYLSQTQFTSRFHLRKIQTLESSSTMILDRQTLRNLDIFQNQQDGGQKGSLYHALNQCVTPMGARKLGLWLGQPLLNAEELQTRLDVVEAFKKSPKRLDFVALMKSVRDIERPLGRIRCERYSARDIKSIGASLSKLPALNAILNTSDTLKKHRLQEENELGEDIDGLLLNELPNSLNEGGMISSGNHAELDELRSISDGGKSTLEKMQTRLRDELDIPTLKIAHNKVFGYYIEVSKAQSSRVPYSFVRKQTLVNAERYIIDELKVFEDKIFGAQDRCAEIELELVQALRFRLLQKSEALMELASDLAELDVLSALATQAQDYGYVRPVFESEPVIELEQARHPVAERLMPMGDFTPNDLKLEGANKRIALITGPNMAGKSTFIRQVGLIQIMAQLGSFVPAKKARMSLVDRVFSRVGAGDDLSSGRSTFMVEMNETANILHNATPKSLVILDEVGRGTSTLDGLSLAWAITEELHDGPHLRPLALFATHYHELTELERPCAGLQNLSIQVAEDKGKVVFLHRIIAGGADKSYGIHVAKLAGLPDRVIERAKELLDFFERKEKSDASALPPKPRLEALQPLFMMDEVPSLLRQKLQSTDINSLTPVQALVFLEELKELAENG